MALNQREIQKKALVTGLFFGLIALAISIVSLYIRAKSTHFFIVMGAPIVLSIIVPILLAILFCIHLRKAIGGYWIFREAVTGIFVLFISAYLLKSVGDLVYAKFIDKNITNAVKSNTLRVTSDFVSTLNTPTEQLDETIDKIKATMQEEPKQTIGRIVQQLAITIIFIFVASLLFAAIFKKERPVFDLPNDIP